MARKIRLHAEASSNISYNRTEYLDLPEGWDEMGEDEQGNELDERAAEWIWNDISLSAEVVEE
jgi:hypothetical protein